MDTKTAKKLKLNSTVRFQSALGRGTGEVVATSCPRTEHSQRGTTRIVKNGTKVLIKEYTEGLIKGESLKDTTVIFPPSSLLVA